MRRWWLTLLVAMFMPYSAYAANLAGRDKARWGMSSAEIARLYPGRATRLDGRIDFGRFYTDVALRRAPFAGLDFTVYFQMEKTTGRLARVLLERRRQYATPEAWRRVLDALDHAFGAPTARCTRAGNPLAGDPELLDRVWKLPHTTVVASFIDFGVGQSSELSRRLLIRYAPAAQSAAPCAGPG